MLSLNRDAARFFYSQLSEPCGRAAREYVRKRGISPQMVTRFGLGCAPDEWQSLTDAMLRRGYTKAELLSAGLVRASKNGGGVYDTFRNRLMFPVIDIRGSVIGFSGRILDDGEPKYMNSPETLVYSKSHNLFALNLAKKSKLGYIILSEGNIDVVSLHQAGFDCAVASLGTSLTPEQARLISRYANEVVIAYDGDEAGQKASQRAIGILQKLDLKVRVLRVTGAKDPDEFIKKYGPIAFENLLAKSQNHIEYRFSDVASKHDLASDEGRVAFLKDATALLAGLPNAVEREVYAGRAAEMANVSPDAILREVERERKKNAGQAKRRSEREESRPMRQLQPKSRALHFDDPVSAAAERGVLRLLCYDPALFSDEPLTEADFSVPEFGKLYAALREQTRSGGTPSIALLQGFSGAEISLLTEIVSEPFDPTNADKALGDYIEKIKAAKLVRLQRGENSENAMNAFADELRKRKAYRG